MQCISCGKILEENQKICSKCGKKQPLAETKDLTKRPILKSLSPLFLLVALTITPLSIVGISIFLFIAISEKIALYKIIIGIANILLITALPVILSIIFKHIK